LLEQGLDPRKLEFWHHRVDGWDGDLMDWPCTNSYVLALAAALNVPLYFTWRIGGFEGEMLRENSRTAPICFEAPQPDGTVEVVQRGGEGGSESTRMAFPQVSANLSVRWCSAYLKIDQARCALRNQERFRNSRTLFVSGERAEESPGRATYAMFERDDTDARDSPKLARHIDRYRPVHRWSEADVWAIIERWGVNPHPSYRLGWSRCSCAGCIFNGADEYATLRQLNPPQFNKLVGFERRFGRTIKRNIDLESLANKGTAFEYSLADAAAALSPEFTELILLPAGQWKLPAGAYSKGGGPS
jgi:3'-phosphoadenosine 5'-phosphosulfate sulfotransferase (PAPS reductase)/FAD synthetase